MPTRIADEHTATVTVSFKPDLHVAALRKAAPLGCEPGEKPAGA